MKRMKIMFSGKYPGNSAGAKRVFLYQKGLNKMDINCDVISAFKRKKERLGWLIDIVFSPYRNFLTTFNVICKSDILFAYGFGWNSLILMSLACKMKQAKMVIEVNEKPYSPYGNKITEIKLIKRLNQYLFKSLILPNMNGFVVISTELEKYVIKYKSCKAPIIKIPIIINPDKGIYSKKKINAVSPFIFHAGSLSEQKDGIVGVFRAFAEVSMKMNKTLHFYLTDNIAPKNILQEIDEIIIKNDLQKVVHFIGKISEDLLVEYQKQSIGLILFKPDNEQNKYNFSTKLVEYLSLGKLVIYTPVGEMKYFLKNNINALEVEVGDIQQLANRILLITDNNNEVSRISEEARKLAQNEFNYLPNCKRLAEFFRRL